MLSQASRLILRNGAHALQFVRPVVGVATRLLPAWEPSGGGLLTTIPSRSPALGNRPISSVSLKVTPNPSVNESLEANAPAIAGIDKAIKGVEGKIEVVEAQIDDCARAISELESKGDRSAEDNRRLEYLRDEKKALRDKEQALRDEKKALRDEKLMLMSKPDGTEPSVPANTYPTDAGPALLADLNRQVDEAHTILLKELYEMNDLAHQQQATGLGALLMKPIPVISVKRGIGLLPQLFDHVGSIDEFAKLVQDSSISDLQDKYITAIAQASGAGKTKLAYSLGMQSSLVVVIRVAMKGGRFSAPFGHLINDYLQPLLALDPSPANAKLIHDAAVDLLRILEGSYVQWVRLQVEKLLQARPDASSQDVRLAALRCVRNGRGDSGVLAVLKHTLQSVVPFRTIPVAGDKTAAVPDGSATRAWLTMVNKGICALPHCSDLPIVVSFDEIPATLNQLQGLFVSARTGAKHDLFYGLMCVMNEAVEFDWHQNMCGTYYDIIDRAGIDGLSPVRGILKTVKHLPLFTEEDMMKSIESYLDVRGISTDTLRATLRRIRGRPIHFFNTFWRDVSEGIFANRTAAWTPEQLQALLERCASNAAGSAVLRYQEMIEEYWKNKLTSSNAILSDLCIQLYHAVKMNGGKMELLGGDSDELMRSGILNVGREDRIADLNQEPALVRAIEAVGDKKVRDGSDGILNMIARRFAGSNVKQLKGSTWEEIFTWNLLQEVIRARDGVAQLETALKPLLPDGFLFPKVLKSAQLSCLSTLPAEPDALPSHPTAFHALFDESGKVRSTRLLFPVDEQAGADFVFFIRWSDGCIRLVLGQAKAKTKSNLVDMLKTSSLAWQFTDSPQFQALTAGKQVGKWSEKRAEFVALVRSRPDIFEGSVRLITSAGGFAPGTVQLVNALNKHYPNNPILLCQSSKDVFGPVHNIIAKETRTAATSNEGVIVPQSVDGVAEGMLEKLSESFLNENSKLLPKSGMSDDLKARVERVQKKVPNKVKKEA